MKGGQCYEILPGFDMPVWHGKLSALPSLLTGKTAVCKWDHVGPPLSSKVGSPGKD